MSNNLLIRACKMLRLRSLAAPSMRHCLEYQYFVFFRPFELEVRKHDLTQVLTHKPAMYSCLNDIKRILCYGLYKQIIFKNQNTNH